MRLNGDEDEYFDWPSYSYFCRQNLPIKAEILFSVKASDIGSKWTGQSEKKVTLLFEEAHKQYYSVIFIDELDGICSNRDSSPDEHGKKVLISILKTEIDPINT